VPYDLDVDVRLLGLDDVSRSLDVEQELRKRLRRTTAAVTERLIGHIRATKFQGRPLRASRGRLFESLRGEVREGGDAITGRVAVTGEPRRWARIHEEGGLVRVAGYRRRGRDVNPYSYYARRRAFLEPSLREMEGEIVAMFEQAVSTVVADGR
jgi:hypothetical protein